MSTHKQIDRICCGVLVFVLLLTILFMNAGMLGVKAVTHVMGYESGLFDTSIVHTIDIEMEDWDTFLENCTNEEYVSCSLVIDQNAYKNVAIRAKGNTSLTSVASYGNNRYSFKVEFDHYDKANTYYGLDKLCLNNIIQDNTYMKDYVTYQMMSGFSVDAPLCSFAYITVNGEDFGLYLAVEGVEESFLERNYGSDYGNLYKPDSMSMGGGRGNGAGFAPEDLDEFRERLENEISQGGAVFQPAEMPVEDIGNLENGMLPGDAESQQNEMPPEEMENPGNEMLPEDAELQQNGMPPERMENPGNGMPPGDAEFQQNGMPPRGMENPGNEMLPGGIENPGNGMPPGAAEFQQNEMPPGGIENPGTGMPSGDAESQQNEMPPGGIENPGNETPPEGMENPENEILPEGVENSENKIPGEDAEIPQEGMPADDYETAENEIPQENMADNGNKMLRENAGMQDGKKQGGPGGMSMGSEDVSLIYTDDEYDSYSNIFDSAKTEITDRDKDRLIASLKDLNEGNDIENVVDVEEVIRYFVVHNFVCNFDSYTGSMIHNYYLYEEEGKFSMIPWDYNLAFGGFESGTDAQSLVNYPIDSPVSGGTVESRPMLAWIFASEKYTELYHQYFSEFIEQYFTNDEFENMVETVSEMIAPYVEKDPTKFCSYEEFQEGVSALKTFCKLRAESVQGQLDGTISSTASGMLSGTKDQQSDEFDVIEAANLSIEAMGTMGNGFDRGGGPGENRSEMKVFPGGNEPIPADFPEKPETFSEDLHDMRTMNQPNIQRSDIRNILILTGVSIVMLFTAILYACKYKRYV